MSDEWEAILFGIVGVLIYALPGLVIGGVLILCMKGY